MHIITSNIMVKELSNNVLALVVIGVMVLSIISTSVVWFSITDDVAPITGAMTGYGGPAQVGLTILPHNESATKEIINGEEEQS